MARRLPHPPRLSAVESLILELLVASDDAMYGLQLVAASRRRLKRGTIYVTLGPHGGEGVHYLASGSRTSRGRGPAAAAV